MRIHFYARPNEGLLPMNAMEILRTNAAADALETKPAGEKIPNYCFSPLSEDERLPVLVGVQPGQDVRFIGHDTLKGVDRLCLTHGACTQDKHTCGGLFQKVAGVTDLHLLICRIGPLPVGTDPADAIASGDYPNTEHLPGEDPANPVHYNRIVELANSILDSAGWSDKEERCLKPDSAEAAHLFDTLEALDRVKVLAVGTVRAWLHARYTPLRDNHQADLSAFDNWVRSLDQKEGDLVPHGPGARSADHTGRRLTRSNRVARGEAFDRAGLEALAVLDYEACPLDEGERPAGLVVADRFNDHHLRRSWNGRDFQPRVGTAGASSALRAL
jgi:hypothetical protein